MVNIAQNAGALSDTRYTPPGQQVVATEYGQATRGIDSAIYANMLTGVESDMLGRLPSDQQEPAYLAVAEDQRRRGIEASVAAGDYGTARAQVGQAVGEYDTAARAARALGDEAAAARFETARDSYAASFQAIDTAQFATDHVLIGPVPKGAADVALPDNATYEQMREARVAIVMPVITGIQTEEGERRAGGAGDVVDLTLPIGSTRDRLQARNLSDLEEVRDHIEQRMPPEGKARPADLYAEGRVTPLTPREGG
jgi:hypothetical protein